MTKEELLEVRKAAWSIREDSHVGEYLGSLWDEVCQDTFHYYRDALDPAGFLYDTDRDRMFRKSMNDAARRIAMRERDEKVNRRKKSGRMLPVREDGIPGEASHLPRDSKSEDCR